MRQPNILLILTDQQRLDTISARHNNFAAKTPHMDKLLRHGAFFDNASAHPPSAPLPRINNLYLHNGVELYNLKSAPHEITNLAHCPAHAATQKSLHEKLLHHIRTTNDPFFTYTPANAAGEPFCTQPDVTQS